MMKCSFFKTFKTGQPQYCCIIQKLTYKPQQTTTGSDNLNYRCYLHQACYHQTIKHNCKSVNNDDSFNPLNAELNPICHLLALLGVHFLHVSRIRVKSLTLRLLMSYIYGAPILDVSRSHMTKHHSR